MGSSGAQSGGLFSYQFNVQSYGAKGDGVTNDQTAINNAIAAAYSHGLSTGSNYAEVIFPSASGYYNVSGSLTQGGTTKGNSLLPLPVHPVTSQKFTMVFRGAVDTAGLWHWQQTTPQTGGVSLVTTVAGTNDATFGEASVLGGPTPAQGYGQSASLFSNMLVVVDGVQIVVPNDPHICGFDFNGLAEQHVKNAATKSNATPSTVTAPTQTWQFGLRCCDNNNNDYSVIDTYTAQGQNYGIITNEHLVANEIATIYCVAGIEHGTTATGHGAVINYFSAESCQVGLGAVNAAFPAKILIKLLDWEGGTGGFAPFAVVNDGSNRLFGDVNVMTVGTSTHLASGTGSYHINGASNMRVYDYGYQAGFITAPGMFTSGVATLNPFFRDAVITITGGTVSAIAVDGHTTGLTSGTIFLPTNKTLTITYTVAPSWNWTLL